MGRPPLDEGKKKGPGVGLRLRPSMREALELSAKEHGNSLSHEMEMRLEWSFLNISDPAEQYLLVKKRK